MVLLTFTIGVLNLCLGYALAVNLGYGPATLADAFSALSATPSTDERAGNPARTTESPADTNAGEVPQELVPEPEEAPDPDAPEAELSEMEKWDREMGENETSLTALGARLRKGKARNDGAAINKCVIELRQLCELLLERQGEAVGEVEKHFIELGNPEASNELQDALLSQLSQVESTIGNSRQVDAMTDPLDAAEKMLVEIERLRVVGRGPREILRSHS